MLAGTFGVFALVGARTSGGSQFVNLAVGLSLGILMDTTAALPGRGCAPAPGLMTVRRCIVTISNHICRRHAPANAGRDHGCREWGPR